VLARALTLAFSQALALHLHRHPVCLQFGRSVRHRSCYYDWHGH
jgi:hypothetical protein